MNILGALVPVLGSLFGGGGSGGKKQLQQGQQMSEETRQILQQIAQWAQQQYGQGQAYAPALDTAMTPIARQAGFNVDWGNNTYASGSSPAQPNARAASPMSGSPSGGLKLNSQILGPRGINMGAVTNPPRMTVPAPNGGVPALPAPRSVSLTPIQNNGGWDERSANGMAQFLAQRDAYKKSAMPGIQATQGAGHYQRGYSERALDERLARNTQEFARGQFDEQADRQQAALLQLVNYLQGQTGQSQNALGALSGAASGLAGLGQAQNQLGLQLNQQGQQDEEAMIMSLAPLFAQMFTKKKRTGTTQTPMFEDVPVVMDPRTGVY